MFGNADRRNPEDLLPRMRWPSRTAVRVHGVPGVRLGAVRVIADIDGVPEFDLGAIAAPPRAYSAWLELGQREDGGTTDASTVTRYLTLPPKGILNSPTVTRMPFWSVNPYIGCEFGCAYCYARDTHRWTVERAASRPDAPAAVREVTTLPSAIAFERRVLVKEGAAKALAAALNRLRDAEYPVVIGTATDPYQPAERRFELTRSLLKLMRQYHGLRIGVITKSPLIARDAELLAQLAQQHDVTINLSLASVDAPLLRLLEPRTPAPHARIRAMAKLTAAGVKVGLLIAPILPGLTDGKAALRKLMTAARDAGASWVSGSPLRMGPATRRTLIPWLERERPALARRYLQHYNRGQGVSKCYAAALQNRIQELRTEIGLVERRMDRERMRRVEEIEMFATK